MSNTTVLLSLNGTVHVYDRGSCSGPYDVLPVAVDTCLSLPTTSRVYFASAPKCANGTTPLFAGYYASGCKGGILNQRAYPVPAMLLGQCLNKGTTDFVFWCDGAPGLSLDPPPPRTYTTPSRPTFPAPTKVPDPARIRFLPENATCFDPTTEAPTPGGEVARLGTNGSCLAIGSRKYVFESSAVCDDGSWANIYAYEDTTCAKLWWAFSQNDTAGTIGSCGEATSGAPIRGMKMVCPPSRSNNAYASSGGTSSGLIIALAAGIPGFLLLLVIASVTWRKCFRRKKGGNEEKGKAPTQPPGTANPGGVFAPAPSDVAAHRVVYG